MASAWHWHPSPEDIAPTMPTTAAILAIAPTQPLFVCLFSMTLKHSPLPDERLHPRDFRANRRTVSVRASVVKQRGTCRSGPQWATQSPATSRQRHANAAHQRTNHCREYDPMPPPRTAAGLYRDTTVAEHDEARP